MSLMIKAKVSSGKYSNGTRTAQEKRKLFLRYVTNIVKEFDLHIWLDCIYMAWLIRM